MQVRAVQEMEKEVTAKLSRDMTAKVDIIQRQAGEATQVAVQAQSAVQAASATMTEYEVKMSTMSNTLAQLQQLIIEERKKRIDMEHQLSSAQDQIGAAERRSEVWATKNQQLESEVKSWMTAYNEQVKAQQEASTSNQPKVTQGLFAQSTIPSVSSSSVLPTFGVFSAPNVTSTTQQQVSQQAERQIVLQQEPAFGEIAPQTRRVSFGSAFTGSSGINGGGNDDHNEGTFDRDVRQQQQSGATFNLEIKPKDPPMFYSRATEDVSTWISKVSDFFYLTGATER